MPSATSPDPRNEDDFDTWTYGTEPIPNDPTWITPMNPTAQPDAVRTNGRSMGSPRSGD